MAYMGPAFNTFDVEFQFDDLVLDANDILNDGDILQYNTGTSLWNTVQNLTIPGNLIVNGTTTTVNSTTVTVDDPVFTLGGDTAPASDDNKDRGIEFRWHDGSTAKTGFFGFDNGSGVFTYIPDATNTGEVFAGTHGSAAFLDASFSGDTAIKLPVGTTAQRPTALQGHVRFNTTDSTFEGYDGSNWGSLGGVKDIDQDTYIAAEETADDDTLRFYTAGTQRASIDASGNATFAGNVQIDGTLTVDGIATLKAGSSGSIAIGDDATDNVVFNADVNSNLTPDTNGTYNLGSTTQNWNTAFLRTLDSSTGTITVDTTGSFVLPVGTTVQRPSSLAQGMIRYNTTDSTFEGYDGSNWGSLGGVKDVDQDTYITAEETADDDTLRFYTAGTQRASIDASGNATFAGNVQIDGTLTVDGIATLKAGASGSIAIGDDATDNVVFNADVNSDLVPDTNGTYNLGSTAQNWNKAFLRTLDSSTGTVTVDTTGSFVLPVGTTVQRPSSLAQGMIRYNTTDSTFEGYDGSNWGSLGGVKDVDQDTYITAEETADDDTLKFYTAGTERMSVSNTGQVKVETELALDGVQVMATATGTTAAVTQTAIDTFAIATYRSAKYVVQAVDTVSNEYHVTELLVIHDGTSAFASEYGIIHTGSDTLATYDVDVNSGNVRLLATPASTNSTQFKITRSTINV